MMVSVPGDGRRSGCSHSGEAGPHSKRQKVDTPPPHQVVSTTGLVVIVLDSDPITMVRKVTTKNGKRKASPVYALRRSSRKSIPAQRFFSQECYHDGTIQHTVVERCGLEQPNPEARKGGESDLCKLGTEAWKVLVKHGWKAPNAGRKFFLPKKKQVEGVTLFKGYEALGKAYQEKGKDAGKLMELASLIPDKESNEVTVATNVSAIKMESDEEDGGYSNPSTPSRDSRTNKGTNDNAMSTLISLKAQLNSLVDKVEQMRETISKYKRSGKVG